VCACVRGLACVYACVVVPRVCSGGVRVW